MDWLMQFDNIEKLRLLNRMVAKPETRLTDEEYILFIEKYYYDVRFNKIYDAWIRSDKNKYFKPSLDHIVPISRGGVNSVDNLQILTWFENRCKNDMMENEWDKMKKKIEQYFI